MIKIFDYLDNYIELFKQKNGDYPAKIIMNKITHGKLIEEIDCAGMNLKESCWAEHKDNYRGIPIEIEEVEFIKLE